MEAYRQAIRLKPDYAEAHYGLGLAYANLGHWQEAVYAYRQALQLKPDYAEVYYNLGWALTLLGRFSEAQLSYQRAREIARELGNAAAEATALIGLAQVSDTLEGVDAVQQYFLQALQLYQQGGNLQGEAFVLTEIGRLHLDRSRYDEALNFYHQALSKYREAKDLKGQRELLARIGEVYLFWVGDAETAARWYQDALEISRAARDAPGEVRTLAMLLMVDAYRGHEEALKEHWYQAKRIIEEAVAKQTPLAAQEGTIQQKDQARDIVFALARLAQVGGFLLAAGFPDQAISYLNVALHIHLIIPTREFLKETAIDLYYLGVAYSSLGQQDEALKVLQQAEVIARRFNSPEIFRVLHRMGLVREKQGQLQAALTLCTQAADIFEKVSLQQGLEEVKIPFREGVFSVYQNILTRGSLIFLSSF